MWCNHNCLMQLGTLTHQKCLTMKDNQTILENLFSFFYACEKEVNTISRNNFQMLSTKIVFGTYDEPFIVYGFRRWQTQISRFFDTNATQPGKINMIFLQQRMWKTSFSSFNQICVCFVLSTSIGVMITKTIDFGRPNDDHSA